MIFDDKGRCIGYRSNDSFESKGNGPFGSLLTKCVAVKPPPVVKRRAPYEDDVSDLSSDDDTIEMVESGVQYLVNGVKARIKKPRIKCNNVKLTVGELAIVKLQEAAEEREKSGKVD